MKNDFRKDKRRACRFITLLLVLGVLTSVNTPAQKKIAPPIKAANLHLTPGYSLIDGDIQMPKEFVEAVLHGQKAARPDAAFRTNLWAGIVPFEFDDNVASVNRFNMLQAMSVLEAIAQVDFVECQSGCHVSNYVHIRDSTNDTDGNGNDISRNDSAVGMVGGQQIINIVSWNSKFTIVHELMHCLGVFHEQSRADRDTYVTINCGNVQGGCNGTLFNNNFMIPGDALNYNYYDFDSVMHYGQCSFSTGTNCPAGGTQTITVKAPYTAQWQNAIGQRTHLSEMDKTIISFLYPANNWTFLDCTYDGGSGAPAGTFFRPYATFFDAYLNTPAGGTIWVTKICSFPAVGTYTKPLTIKTAPGVITSIGN